MIMDKYRKSLKMGEEKLKKISITKHYCPVKVDE